MEKEVLKLVEKILKKDLGSLNIESTPRNTKGWDSLNHMKIILASEELFSTKFSDDEIVKIKDVKSLIDTLSEKVNR